MPTKLYTLIISFSGLSVVCGLLQGIIVFLIGGRFFFLDAFFPWFWTVTIISISGSVLLLKYYYDQKYWFTFSAGTICAIANASYAFVTYMIIISRKLETFGSPVFLFLLMASIVYGVSLSFPPSGKKRWLKASGFFILTLALILGSTVIWSKSSPTPQLSGALGKIAQWTSLAISLVPVLFILHFRSEGRLIKTESRDQHFKGSLEKNNRLGGFFENTMSFVGLVGFIGMLAFGVMITSESYSSLYWDRRNFEKTKELAALFEARTFVNPKGDTLFYRLLKPLEYDSTRKYPLVVSLPYGGQPGTDKIRQIEGAAAAEILAGAVERTKYPAFLFIPNCPPGSGWGGIPNYPSIDSLVYQAIVSLDTQFAIDAKRRYVTGISRGGYGTWNFICTRPDLFAAAIPVCGEGDPKHAPAIVNIPVWAFHGEKDHNVPVSGSRDMINAIRKAGGNPKYTEFANEGHNIWNQVSSTPGLWDWLFAQKRE